MSAVKVRPFGPLWPAFLSACLIAPACSSDPVDDPSPADAGAVADAGDAPDAGGPVEFGPLAPEVELTPEPIAVQLVGIVSDEVRADNGGDDPILEQLQDGTFACPDIGFDEFGVRWRGAVPPENGEVEPPRGGAGVMYAVVCIESAEARGLVAQVDNFAGLFVNGAEQPGDFYRSGRLRLPAVLRPGTNVLAARGSTDTRRGAPIFRLWRTPDELAFNRSDATFPHLRVADMEPQFYGVPVLNLREAPVLGLRAVVEDSELFEETVREHVALPAASTTQVGFELRLKAPLTITATQAPVQVSLRIEAVGLDFSYGTTVEIEVKPPGTHFRGSFVSAMDESVQYYGVAPPPQIDPARDYGMILSLHGAGVQAFGQARAYGLKDWAYVVAGTNRRPFGFDWEDWGRLDALEVLEEGKRRFGHDPSKVYVTGHSMGGHGTWHVGLTHPEKFALIGPSAGWSHFDVYGGARSPAPGPGIGGAFAAAQQHSQTPTFLENASRRAVYIIHGDADNNVPVSLGRAMRDALEPICEDLHYHEEPGAGHWWDGYPEPGAQCVDWTPMMDLMQERSLDPMELEFDFRTAGPWVNPSHSFVRVESALDPYTFVGVTSRATGSQVVLTTENARSLVLDGAALAERGVSEVVVDDDTRAVTEGPMRFGPEGGKRPGQHGPLKEAFFTPFVYVYPDGEAGEPYRELAAYFTTYWSFIGNGYSPAVPLSALTDELRASHNVIYLGVGPDGMAEPTRAPIGVSGAEIVVGDDRYTNSAAIFVFPEGEKLSAVFYATEGAEDLLFGFVPFRSGFGAPDYVVFTYGGSRTAGFFDAEWQLDPALRR